MNQRTKDNIAGYIGVALTCLILGAPAGIALYMLTKSALLSE